MWLGTMQWMVVCVLASVVLMLDNFQCTLANDQALLLNNRPIVVDTNRLNDGVSSVSPFQWTAPSFEEYHGPLQSGYATRQHHGSLLTEVGLSSQSFQVFAQSRWQSTRRTVTRWEWYEFSVPTTDIWLDYSTSTNADGYSSHFDAVKQCYVTNGVCKSYINAIRRIPTQNWLKLICCIGDYIQQLIPSASQERYMPLREEIAMNSCYAIGTRATIKADRSGELLCFANDALGSEGDNSGHVTVSVRRVRP